MTDMTLEVLRLLNKYGTTNNICKRLKISRNKLMYYVNLITNEGYLLDREYYSDGDIKFYKKFLTDGDLALYNNEYEEKKLIYTKINQIQPSSSKKEIKAVAISDLHIGNNLERIDQIERIFEYCIKNDVHIILCCGDIIDGTFSKGEIKVSDVVKQTERFIKKYPYDSNILTFTILGDHDISALKNENFDPAFLINKERHDVIVSGYNYAKIKMMESTVALHHNLVNKNKIQECNIVLHGHTHQYKAYESTSTSNIQIYVPTLSDIMSEYPSAVDLKLQFDSKVKKATNIEINHIAHKGSEYTSIKKTILDVPNNAVKKYVKIKKHK